MFSCQGLKGFDSHHGRGLLACAAVTTEASPARAVDTLKTITASQAIFPT